MLALIAECGPDSAGARDADSRTGFRRAISAAHDQYSALLPDCVCGGVGPRRGTVSTKNALDNRKERVILREFSPASLTSHFPYRRRLGRPSSSESGARTISELGTMRLARKEDGYAPRHPGWTLIHPRLTSSNSIRHKGAFLWQKKRDEPLRYN